MGTMAVKAKFYSVAVGRKTGIFSTWGECVTQTKGFSSAKYKSFTSKEAAQQFIDDHAKNNSSKPKSNSKRANCSSDVAVEDRKSSSTSAKKGNFMLWRPVVHKEFIILGMNVNLRLKGTVAPYSSRLRRRKVPTILLINITQSRKKKKRKINDGE